MSSTNKTANLKLHSWVRTDPVVCEDFNDNFNKIDAAVGKLNVSSGNCQLYVGSYTGSGSKTHSLTFPKLPVVLFIQVDWLNTAFYGGFVFDGAYFLGPLKDEYFDTISVSGTTVTFKECDTGSSRVFNSIGKTYRYVALAPMA